MKKFLENKLAIIVGDFNDITKGPIVYITPINSGHLLLGGFLGEHGFEGEDIQAYVEVISR